MASSRPQWTEQALFVLTFLPLSAQKRVQRALEGWCRNCHRGKWLHQCLAWGVQRPGRHLETTPLMPASASSSIAGQLGGPGPTTGRRLPSAADPEPPASALCTIGAARRPPRWPGVFGPGIRRAIRPSLQFVTVYCLCKVHQHLLKFR